jgi:hypothetical protein
VEYEDDPDYSIRLIDLYLKDHDNGDKEGALTNYKSVRLYFTRSCLVDGRVKTLSEASKGSGQFGVSNFCHYKSEDYVDTIWSGSYFGIYESAKFSAGLIDTFISVDCENDSWLSTSLKISTKKIRANTYTADLKMISDYYGNYDDIDNKIRFEFYNNLDPNNQGAMGNLANAYAVTANNGNIYLSRNGVTINVTKYAAGSGIETAEPSMYIVKNIGDRELTGPSEYNAMENVHIVWQQKNAPEDKWRIYYAVVPFRYEELPDGGFSIMSLPPAPQTASAPEPAKQKYFIENVLNYPNPFADETTLTYELAGYSGEVRARIYTITGRLVRALDGLPGAAGYNEYKFDGNDSRGQSLANDVYYLVLLARDERGRWVKARSKIVKLR